MADDPATAVQDPPAAVAAPETYDDPTPPAYGNLFNGDGSFKEGWTDNLGDEFAPFKESLAAKKFANLENVLLSYSNLERKMGAASNDEFVRMPGEKADPATIAAFRAKMGVPATPEDYGLKRPEGVPEEAWNEDQAKGFAKLAHEIGLPKNAAAKLVEWQGQRLEGEIKAHNEALEKQNQEADAELRTAWGEDYERNMDLAARVVRHAAASGGYEPDDPYFASPKSVKQAYVYGQMIDESRLPRIKGDSVNLQGDPATQLQSIQQDKSHPYWSKPGDANYNKTARETAIKLVTRLGAEIDRRKGSAG